jgi:hypothetical protein
MRPTLVEKSIQDSLKAKFSKKKNSAFDFPKFSSVETSPRLGTESAIFGKIKNLILKFSKICHEVLTGSTLLESYLGQTERNILKDLNYICKFEKKILTYSISVPAKCK